MVLAARRGRFPCLVCRHGLPPWRRVAARRARTDQPQQRQPSRRDRAPAPPTDPNVELLEPEANAGRLAPGETTRADLFLRALGEDLDPVDLEDRVSTAVFGTVLKVPVDLALDGSAAKRQAPQAEIALSTTVDAGPRELVLTLRDDEALSSVTTWVGRQKVGWQRLTGTKAVVRVPVDLPPGTHRLYVDVQDSAGSHTRQEAVVQAVDESSRKTTAATG